jgi:hypothetical protein
MDIEITLTHPACVSRTSVFRWCPRDSYVFLLIKNTLLRMKMEVLPLMFLSYSIYPTKQGRPRYTVIFIQFMGT